MKRIESILVATDLTEGSDEVLRAAAAVAEATGAKLHVLHAFEFQAVPYSEEHLGRVSFAGRIEEAKRTLGEQVERNVPAGVEVASQEVLIFVAHRAIVEHATAVGADLVVLGPHRRRPVAPALLGSTADRVIRTAAVPCLLVRGTLPLPLRRVVVPIDLSRVAHGALDVALAWSETLGARVAPPAPGTEVVVVHVIPRAFQMESFPFDRAVIGPELHGEVESALEEMGGASLLVREEVCWGDDPAEEILRAADREDADLLVLATHGHGALRRALIGSVASAVARRARRSVLLVPPELWKTAPGGEARG